jgi:hypothetical protein
MAGNGTYISTDPLANVRYDNRYDLSLGMAYGHIAAGPVALQGANLGGLDLSGSYWLTKRLGVEGSGRSYLGSSGGGTTNPQALHGPFVSEYLFAGGAEILGPHNKHGALIGHALVGGAYFDAHLGPPTTLNPYPARTEGFYDNQIAPAAIFGGHIDLNRSAHWVFRITPDALSTRYGFNYTTVPAVTSPHTNWNFGISVGAEYKFSKKR